MRKNLLKKTVVSLGIVGLVFHGALLAAEPKVAVAFAPVEGSSEAGLVSQIMQAELSQSAQLMLVERTQIDKALRELKLDAQGMLNSSTVQKLGSMIGARYFCNSSVSTTGNKSLAIVKVIDVETTLAKLAYVQIPNKDDAVEAGKALAKQVEGLVAQFEKDRAAPKESVPVAKAKPIPPEWKRPTVMVIIPETHVRQRELIDPAGETEIDKRLIADGFKVVVSEYVTLMKKGQVAVQKFSSLKTSTEYAASKKVDVLLYGEAISEQGASVGDFVGCRGRIELKAIRVKGDEILVSDSAEGGATDLAETIAGKKAIKQAANTLADTFLYNIAEKWNK
jgi:hypothetical protein